MVVGNETFIFSQQDVRRVEDTRYFSYNRMLPNGQLQPLTNFGDPWLPDCQVGSLYNLFNQLRPQSPNTFANVTPASPIAGIAKQMDWTSNSLNTSSPPFPMHFTKTTSTTGLEVPAKPNNDFHRSRMTSMTGIEVATQKSINHARTTSMTGIELQAKPSKTTLTTNCSCQTSPMGILQGSNSDTQVRSRSKQKRITFKTSRSSDDDADSSQSLGSSDRQSPDPSMPLYCKRNPRYTKNEG